MIRVDLHSHSEYSKDSRSSLSEIVKAVPRSGLHGLALTDHDELEGALELRRRAPFLVIPGEEIKTASGEIIGLFLNERIPPGLSPVETIERIREQGGVVYVPHPFDRVRGSRITRDQLDEIVDRIDLLEVFNARNALPSFNRRAREYAQERGLRVGAGSDAHSCSEYGTAYVELPAFDNAKEFRDALPYGRWRGRLSSPAVHVRTRIDVLKKRREGAPREGDPLRAG
ncbi:MAG TPA: PHP domain-containing protein [Chloroflexota bacterium]|nr:PHP domain-containing protein [Chloroflexota bacterium]